MRTCASVTSGGVRSGRLDCKVAFTVDCVLYVLVKSLIAGHACDDVSLKVGVVIMTACFLHCIAKLC